jgi:inner membrane protein involved in colicin E2 resistance
MKLFKDLVNLVKGSIDFVVYTSIIIFVLLLLAGNANIGCRQAWLTNAVTCSANLIVPAR